MPHPSHSAFTLEDYNSNDGMLTSIWGPPLWHVLHTMSFNYPVKPTQADKINYKTFVDSLRGTLPCGKCRKNLVENLKKHPLTEEDLKNRESFSRWVYELHEVVNKMLGKVSGLSYADVRDRYENFRARCNSAPTVHVGCAVPAAKVEEKPRCVLAIVPDHRDKEGAKCPTSIQIDDRCVRLANKK